MWFDVVRIARERGVQPRVHGNGFIQLDLNRWQRAHFWGHPAIPCQKTPSPIHNHRFNFASAIMKGALTNIVYQPKWREDGLFTEWQPEPREGEDTRLIKSGRRCDLHVVSMNTWHKAYHANGVDFHETLVLEPTVTIITKTDTPNGPLAAKIPSVLTRGFQDPDNEFDRNTFHPDCLWGIIEDIAG